MSQATSGIGTLLKRGDGGAPETFTTVAEVVTIKGPGQKSEFVDVTSLASTGKYREWLPTFKDGGEVQCDCNFLPQTAAQKNLRIDFENQALRNFQLQFTDAAPTIAAFAAYITGYEPSATVNDALRITVTLKISGQVTYTP